MSHEVRPMNVRVRHGGAILLLLAAAPAGCGQPAAEPGPPGAAAQEIIQFAGSTLWPKTGGIARLSLCFRANPTPLPGELGYSAPASMRDAVRIALQHTWERHGNILITGYGDCVGGESFTIIQSVGLGFGAATSNQGHPASGQAAMGMSVGMFSDPYDLMVYRTVGSVVHELGHVLGFHHEEAKDTWVLPDWLLWLEGDPAPCHPQSSAIGPGLGLYDVNSVMSYCASTRGGPGTTSVGGSFGTAGTGPWSGIWRDGYPEPSSGDIYGVQALYGQKNESALYTISGAGASGARLGTPGAGSGCLTTVPGTTGPGTAVYMAVCGATGAGHQRFRYDFATEKLTDDQSPQGLKLDAYTNYLDLWTDHTGPSLTWRFSNVEIRGLGGMAISGFSSASAPAGAPVAGHQSYLIGTQTWAQLSEADSRNAVTHTRPFRFKIGTGADRAIHALNPDGSDSGLCLDVRWGAITTNGAPVWLWPCNGGSAQRWTFTPGHGEIRLVDALGMCLDVEAPPRLGNPDNLPVYDQQNLQIHACNGRLNQQFYLRGQIQSGSPASNRCLTNRDVEPSVGSFPVTSTTCDAGDQRQQWSYRF